MNVPTLSRLLAIAAVATGLFSSVACAAEKAPSHGSIAVPGGLKPEAVKEAIASALAVRNWTVTEKTGEKVVGHIKQKNNEAILTIYYTQKEITLSCEGWKLGKIGERSKPEIPKSWVDNIKKDVTNRLNEMATAR